MKKRTFKRVASAVAALTMAASLAVPMTVSLAATMMTASAAPHTTESASHTIEIKNEAGNNHTYNVYKIFDGVVPDDGDTNYEGTGSGFGRNNSQYLNDITWADGITGTDFIDALKKYETQFSSLTWNDTSKSFDNGEPTLKRFSDLFTDCTTAASVAQIIERYKDQGEFRRVFADFLKSIEDTVLADAMLKNPADYTVTPGTNSTTISFVTKEGDNGKQCEHDGYYVIIEQGLGNDKTATKTVHLIGVYDADHGAAVDAKSSLPEFTKKVKDKNDSDFDNSMTSTPAGKYDDANGNYEITGDNTDAWQDTADHDISDEIPFQLKATLPSTYADYRTYYLTFHDNINPTTPKSAGDDSTDNVFTFNENSVNAYLQVYTYDSASSSYTKGSTISLTKDTHYTVSQKLTGNKEDYNGTNAIKDWDCDFEIAFGDLKKLGNGVATQVATIYANGGYVEVIVEYTATLTENANLGAIGNWNDAYMTYTNNPNLEAGWTPGEDDEDDNTSTSEIDRVGVFTYQITVDKVDHADGKPLKGAGFTLEKYADNGNGTGTWGAVGAELKGVDMTTFAFKGLDAGWYRLSETTVPAGYNGMKPTYILIVAEHTQDPGDLELTSLNCYITDESGVIQKKLNNGQPTEDNQTWGSVVWTDSETSDDKKDEDGNYLTGDEDDTLKGEIRAKVENTSSALLPGTGGIGTTIFYVVGGTLVVGAGITLITKKRMQKEN